MDVKEQRDRAGQFKRVRTKYIQQMMHKEKRSTLNMTQKIITGLILVLVLVSCQNSKFEQEFGCDTPMGFSNTKTYKDVLSHFEIDIPKSWKTSLYYDEYQSFVFHQYFSLYFVMK